MKVNFNEIKYYEIKRNVIVTNCLIFEATILAHVCKFLKDWSEIISTDRKLSKGVCSTGNRFPDVPLKSELTNFRSIEGIPAMNSKGL